MTTSGQIETCRACDVAFARVPGESTSSLVHRYTAWREAHQSCVVNASADAEPVKVRVPRRRTTKVRG